MVIKEYFQLLFPFVLIMFLVLYVSSLINLVRPTKRINKLISIALSAFITFFPFAGLSLAEYLLSLNPNYSIGSLALVITMLWPHLSGKPLMSDRHLWEFSFWNFAISLALCASYLGLIAYDMYALGYRFSIWFVIMALVTIILIWRSNPLSYIFITYIAAFNLRVLPSNNFFDYLTDGFLFVISLGLVVYFTLKYRRINYNGCNA